MKLRDILFWLHLGSGITVGFFLLIIAVTGTFLAFEKQVLDFREVKFRKVEPPVSGVKRLSLDELAVKAGESKPDMKVVGITLQADPKGTVVVSLGKTDFFFVNPYDGTVLGEGAKTARFFFKWAEDWHRWFGFGGGSGREAAHQVKGAVNLVFFLMVISGVILWWPRKGKPVLKFVEGLKGKAKDWNTHNVIGFWISSILLVITFTGLVMSYDWASDLLYRLTGSQPPPKRQAFSKEAKASEGKPQEQKPQEKGKAGPESKMGRKGEGKELGKSPVKWEACLLAAQAQVPGWKSISMRAPKKDGDPLFALIQEGDSLYTRSMLSLDPATASVVKWEPYQEQSLGKKARGLMRPIHTGEIAGLFGQTLAALACLGTLMLVYTGWAMAWRRFFARR